MKRETKKSLSGKIVMEKFFPTLESSAAEKEKTSQVSAKWLKSLKIKFSHGNFKCLNWENQYVCMKTCWKLVCEIQYKVLYTIDFSIYFCSYQMKVEKSKAIFHCEKRFRES